MNASQFLSKQQAKYYWKYMKQITRADRVSYMDEQDSAESFWQYEPTPRAI